MIGLVIAVAAWVLLSLPAALFIARFVEPRPRGYDDHDLPVIADADRVPLPPHLRRPAPVADLT